MSNCGPVPRGPVIFLLFPPADFPLPTWAGQKGCLLQRPQGNHSVSVRTPEPMATCQMLFLEARPFQLAVSQQTLLPSVGQDDLPGGCQAPEYILFFWKKITQTPQPPTSPVWIDSRSASRGSPGHTTILLGLGNEIGF